MIGMRREMFSAMADHDRHALRVVHVMGAVLLMCLVFSFSEGCAMGLSSRLVLFSEVHGTVLKDGMPVQGATVIQEVVWSDNKNDVPPTTVSSAVDGRFSFPVVERNAGVMRVVPHQPVILQKILIRYEGVEYTAWRHTRNSYEDNSEMDGRPLRLECELSRAADFEGTHYGICKAL